MICFLRIVIKGSFCKVFASLVHKAAGFGAAPQGLSFDLSILRSARGFGSLQGRLPKVLTLTETLQQPKFKTLGATIAGPQNLSSSSEDTKGFTVKCSGRGAARATLRSLSKKTTESNYECRKAAFIFPIRRKTPVFRRSRFVSLCRAGSFL